MAPAEARPTPQDIRTVSVIVPHLDDYDNLDACLTLLGEQTFPSDRTEIIIADNGSSRGLDALRELVGARGRVVEVKERGAGPARNAGVRASRARRSRSSTATAGLTGAGSRKVSPVCASPILSAAGSTSWSGTSAG